MSEHIFMVETPNGRSYVTKEEHARRIMLPGTQMSVIRVDDHTEDYYHVYFTGAYSGRVAHVERCPVIGSHENHSCYFANDEADALRKAMADE